MHSDVQVCSAARRCLDAGGPYLMMGRSDRWSGSQLGTPMIQNIAIFGKRDAHDLNALEERLVKEAFAAFRESYVQALEEIVDGYEPAAKQTTAVSSTGGVW